MAKQCSLIYAIMILIIALEQMKNAAYPYCPAAEKIHTVNLFHRQALKVPSYLLWPPPSHPTAPSSNMPQQPESDTAHGMSLHCYSQCALLCQGSGKAIPSPSASQRSLFQLPHNSGEAPMTRECSDGVQYTAVYGQ